MELHPSVKFVIERLERGGFEAWAVGGCVRDALMGRPPHDWDVCTNALPQQTAACLAGFRLIETGLAHGTVTVLVEGLPVEVTTWRVDGAYADNRRPQQVTFVRSLREDLARRDFTANALAYNPAAGLVDYFGGEADIAAKVLRSVGEPGARFAEDGLRLMRALRFGAQLGFALAPDLAAAVHRDRALLKNISAERLGAELRGLITGGQAENILLSYPDVLAVFIPELAPMAGFEQHNPHHAWDVWTHTARAVAGAPPDETVRLALLLHDIGKPPTYSLDENGVGHFYGHQAAGAALAGTILRRLRFDNATTGAVVALVKWHGAEILPRTVPRWLNRLGEAQLARLLQVKRADALALRPEAPDLAALDALEAEMRAVLAARRAFQLKDLAVNGRDLAAMGIAPGPGMGALLRRLLEQVMDGHLPNEKQALLDEAARLHQEG